MDLNFFFAWGMFSREQNKNGVREAYNHWGGEGHKLWSLTHWRLVLGTPITWMKNDIDASLFTVFVMVRFGQQWKTRRVHFNLKWNE